VEEVYNRHNYIEQKAKALDRLAKLIDQIVNPPDRTAISALPIKWKDHRDRCCDRSRDRGSVSSRRYCRRQTADGR
jgi:hypothetical protein